MAASKWTAIWLKQESDPDDDIPSWDRETTGMVGKTNVRNLDMFNSVKIVVPFVGKRSFGITHKETNRLPCSGATIASNSFLAMSGPPGLNRVASFADARISSSITKK